MIKIVEENIWAAIEEMRGLRAACREGGELMAGTPGGRRGVSAVRNVQIKTFREEGRSITGNSHGLLERGNN